MGCSIFVRVCDVPLCGVNCVREIFENIQIYVQWVVVFVPSAQRNSAIETCRGVVSCLLRCIYKACLCHLYHGINLTIYSSFRTACTYLLRVGAVSPNRIIRPPLVRSERIQASLFHSFTRRKTRRTGKDETENASIVLDRLCFTLLVLYGKR